MCIAVPARVVDITPGPMPMGHVAHGGADVACCFAYVPEAKVGDYVIVQTGFAIEVVDPESAAESLALFEEFAGFAPDHESTEGARVSV